MNMNTQGCISRGKWFVSNGTASKSKNQVIIFFDHKLASVWPVC